MIYGELLRAFYQHGFTRIERDDRLHDIFPDQTREKGIELWEKWEGDTVSLVRVKLPFNAAKIELYRLERTGLEEALQTNKRDDLSRYTVTERGEATISRL